MKMTKKGMKTKRCLACGAGTLKLTNIRGRKFNYRDEIDLMVNEDIEVLVCDSCGDLALYGDFTVKFSEALERARIAQKRAAVQHFVTIAAKEYPQVSRAAWEDTLGLSRGYLSRLISGTRTPDAPLEILLEGFARDPKSVLNLVQMAGRRVPVGI
jgi:hypothetical protein